ncbi:MAG: lytic murein transglycosylase [Desulfobacteraceae bacterium]|nr:lytic murein transglycosylase [Desulfobacteraceae bacterium]
MRNGSLWLRIFTWITFLSALAAFPCLTAFAARTGPAEDVYASLKTRLVRDGFSRQQVAAAFQPSPPPMYKLVSQTFRMRESQLNYDQFLAPSEISKARQFILRHRESFAKAESLYGVEPGVIAAILLVETHFGSYTGKTPTLAVFTTFAVMDQKSNRDRVWRLLAPSDRERLGREAFDKKLLSRSEWAYKELTALLDWEKRQKVRPESLRGSVMGAVGWPQFLPSSLVGYGVDGNGDGRIDLYNSDDAIFSTANYLQGHGWCEAKFPSDQEAVIWTYNHSKPYVRTILAIADTLKGTF